MIWIVLPPFLNNQMEEAREVFPREYGNSFILYG